MNETNQGEARSAIVVGAGFGGLAIAIRLQAAGLQVTLLDKREQLGGRAGQLVIDGYTFDTGPSLVTAPGILDDLFRVAGSSLRDEVELLPLDPYYRIFFHDGTRFDYVGDPDRMRSQMSELNQADADRFDDFMAAIEPIFDAVITDRLGSTPFDRVSTLLGFVPRMVRLGGHRTVTRTVNRFFADPRHRFLFSFHPLFVGGNPFATPSIYLMIPFLERRGGVWFTRGGMYSIVQALENRFLALGGSISTGTEVKRILVDGRRAVGVRTATEDLRADLVVSNADVGQTYGTLLSETSRKRWNDRRLNSLEYSMSCFLLYLGVRRQYPELAHHTLILSERYRELLKDIFDRKELADDFSMYLHVPTRSDADMAPPGCESMYVLVPVPNNESGIDWGARAEQFGDKVIRFLEAWGMPDLAASIEVRRTFTPDDFAAEYNATVGNAFAIVPRFTQTAWFRPHNRSEDVAALYTVGASTHPGAGVPGVLLSAETTYRSVAEDLGLPEQWDPESRGVVSIPAQ